MIARLFAVGVAVCIVFPPTRASGQPTPPAAHEDIAFDFMNLLSQRGLHDLRNERWNAYGQFTYITSFKLPFDAPYTNANGSVNSLATDYERSFSGSFTLFFGVRLWKGGEVYFVPEVISERALSNLRGIGGSIQNFELQKTGGEIPSLYRARLFYRQTFGFGGRRILLDSNPMQLGTTIDSRRVVLTIGNFSALDIFDHNSVTWDPRQTFFNMAFMTHSSWDFGADARGYTWGATAEFYWDDWAVRIGRMQPPLNPNTLPVDFRFWDFYSDALEVEHDHTIRGLPGAVRILGYHNHTRTGRFDDAIAAFQADSTKNAASCTSFNYGSGNFTAPDLCWVRRANEKWGIGINLEQYVARDIGLFVRAMYSDGQSEVDAFNAADRDLSFGAVAKGTLWRRPFDVTGIGLGLSWISDIHARYLAMGGIDGFVGDGRLRQGAEGVVDLFYSVNLFRAVWLAADYQLLWNPGFNADRAGPINILGAKVHAEF
jgi:high affinity Mn2+ porin